MSRKPWILFDDAVYQQRGSLALSVGTALRPLDNLAAYEPSVDFAANEVAADWSLTLSSAEDGDAIVLVGLDPTDGASVVVESWRDGSDLSSLIDLGPVAGSSKKRLWAYRYPAVASTTIWRARVTNTTADVIAGRQLVGKAYQPSGDFVRFERTWLDEPGSLLVPESGIKWTGEAVGRRLCRYTWENLTEEEANDDAMAIERHCGSWLPIAVIEDQSPIRTEMCVHGKLNRQPVTNQNGLYWSLTIEVEESAAG